MKYYTYDEPDEHGNNKVVTLSEEQILTDHWDYWCANMRRAGKQCLISRENCIRDWVTVHWATEIDIYAG